MPMTRLISNEKRRSGTKKVCERVLYLRVLLYLHFLRERMRLP